MSFPKSWPTHTHRPREQFFFCITIRSEHIYNHGQQPKLAFFKAQSRETTIMFTSCHQHEPFCLSRCVSFCAVIQCSSGQRWISFGNWTFVSISICFEHHKTCEIYLWYIWEKKQMQKSLRLERKAGETLLWHYEWKEQLADSRRCTHTWGWYTGPALEGSSSGHCWTDPVLTDEPILSDDMGQPRSPGCYQVILSPRKLSDRVLQERMWTCD